MPACLAAADLVVSRSGASTVAELTAVGLASVLIPLPRSPGDHQTANATVLERAGAALLVPDDELDGDRLADVVDAPPGRSAAPGRHGGGGRRPGPARRGRAGGRPGRGLRQPPAARPAPDAPPSCRRPARRRGPGRLRPPPPQRRVRPPAPAPAVMSGSARPGSRGPASSRLRPPRGGSAVTATRTVRRRRAAARSRQPPRQPPPPVPGLDLSQPRRVHVVGIGGAGHERHRLGAGVHGPPGHRAATSRRRAGTERLAARGVVVAVGHDAANLDDPDVVAVSTRHPRAQPRGARGPSARHPRGPPVRGAGRHLCRPPLAGRGRHPRQDHHLVDAGAGAGGGGAAAELPDRRRRQRGRHRRGVGRRRAAGRGGRRERRHLPRAARLGRPGHQRGGRPPRPLRLDRCAAGRLRALPRRHCPAPGWSGSTCRGGPSWPDGPAARAWTVATVGQAADADYRIARPRPSARVGASFELERRGERLGRIELAVPGAHNALNAAAATALALEAGAPFGAAQAALARFAGVARRLQFRGEAGGVTFIDDYAHLPTEVAAAVAAGRAGGWRRVVAVFQPHRYSRIGALWPDFAARLRGGRPGGGHRRLRRRRGAPPRRHRQARGRRRARRPPVVAGGLPAPTGRSRPLPGRRAAARRPVPDARRRRPHLAARRAGFRGRGPGRGAGARRGAGSAGARPGRAGDAAEARGSR